MPSLVRGFNLKILDICSHVMLNPCCLEYFASVPVLCSISNWLCSDAAKTDDFPPLHVLLLNYAVTRSTKRCVVCGQEDLGWLQFEIMD